MNKKIRIDLHFPNKTQDVDWVIDAPDNWDDMTYSEQHLYVVEIYLSEYEWSWEVEYGD